MTDNTGTPDTSLTGGQVPDDPPPPPKNNPAYTVEKNTGDTSVYRWRTGEECFEWWMNVKG